MPVIRTRTKSPSQSSWLSLHAVVRIGIPLILGIAGSIAVGIYVSWIYAPLVLWDITAFLSAAAAWISIRTMNAAETKSHATQDDPGRGIIDVVMLIASVASIAAVLVLIVKAGNAQGVEEVLDIGLGIISILVSWIVVHLIYTFRYADLYFDDTNSIDFNTTKAPTYQDFAYIAFTIGMTYQVSDTSFTTTEMRTTARQHAILSFIFGTVIIATTINTLAGLGK